MRVEQDVLEVLDRATISGATLVLNGKLDRKLYERTNKVLELAGGKWDRRAGAHVFPCPAEDALEPILLTGEVSNQKQDLQAFFTPNDVGARVMDWARILPGMAVLEPSAGEGALARLARDAAGDVRCVEINPTLREVLSETVDPDAICADFMRTDVVELGGPFDRIVMNPPFSKQQDARHVLHAYQMLKPGGVLVAIMSAAVTFRDTALYREVRNLILTRSGTIERLPEGAFKEAGAMVNTVIIRLSA